MTKRTVSIVQLIALLAGMLFALAGCGGGGGGDSLPPLPGKLAFSSDREVGGGEFRLYILDFSNGSVSRLTDDTVNEEMACFSPDGSTVAYTRFTATSSDIYVMNADGSGSPTQLTDDPAYDLHPCYSSNGQLIAFGSARTGAGDIYDMFSNGNFESIMFGSPDLDYEPSFVSGATCAWTRSSGGDLVIMAAGSVLINSSGNDSNPAYSHDGTKIAFSSDRDGDEEIFIADADGTDAQQITHNDNIIDSDPAWSPDGQYIAFSRRDTTQMSQSDIYVTTADGSQEWNVTDNAADDRDPSWDRKDNPHRRNPMRRLLLGFACLASLLFVAGCGGGGGGNGLPPLPGRLAFASDRGQVSGAYQIWVLDFADGTPVRLSSGTTVEEMPDFSPNGATIAYVRFTPGDSNIYVMNADGSGSPLQLTNDPALDQHPSYSSNGQHITFYTDRSGAGDIWTMLSNGSGELFTFGNSDVDYAPDCGSGTVIAWTRFTGGNFVIMAQGNVLINSLGNDSDPAYSPNHAKIAFCSDRDGDKEIFVANANGTNQQQITHNTVNDYDPSWSPDGSYLAFTRRSAMQTDNEEIWVMTADGSQEWNVTNNAANDRDPSWAHSILLQNSRGIE